MWSCLSLLLLLTYTSDEAGASQVDGLRTMAQMQDTADE